MIEFENVSFGYQGENSDLLRGVNLNLPAGELVLVCGPTGSGKSTLLKLMNALAPNFTGGKRFGKIRVDGVEINEARPNQLAALIGYVNQQPEGAFVADTVAAEILFGMEQLGFDSVEMQTRLGEIAKLTDLDKLLDRNLNELSGGQQQIVAVAAALAAGQKVLLLDEPTSALDHRAVETVMKLLRKLVDQTGITVVLAEHRIERVIEWVDSVVLVNLDASVQHGKPEQIFQDYRLVPPVVQLGQLLGWNPLEITTERARKRFEGVGQKIGIVKRLSAFERGEVLLQANSLRVQYHEKLAVNVAELTLRQHEVTALMGANGAGKSSLLYKLWQDHQSKATLVPQRAADLLFLPSVHLEFEESDRMANKPAGSTAALFTKLSQRVDPAMHPRDLSTGQQLALVLAIQLVKGANIVLLDEPTGGLDYAAKSELAEWILEMRSEGKSVLLASHDVEFVAACADRIIELHDGEILRIASPEELLGHDGVQKTQIAEVFEIPSLISLRQIEVKDA